MRNNYTIVVGSLCFIAGSVFRVLHATQPNVGAVFWVPIILGAVGVFISKTRWR